MHKTTRNAASCRRGFTLLELLITIIIIVLLAALLFPALGGARRSVRVTQVRTEISGLETAIADFKAIYGMDPPSRIVLCQTAAHWDAAPAGFDPVEIRRSRALIRQIWPQFSFQLDRDIDDDPSTTDPLVLTGPECLVFFLGGVFTRTPTADGQQTFVTRGFSKNSLDPFQRTGTNREGPFFQFDAGRLQDSGSGMLVYLDPLPGQSAPYLYLSSYNARGYETDDLGGHMQQRYRRSSSTGPFYNPQTFQIISPGFDGKYGRGGAYDPERVDEIPDPNQQPNQDDWVYLGDLNQFSYLRNAERDNITNFHNGTLAP